MAETARRHAGYSESCCWNDIRDHCPLRRQEPEYCACACHQTNVRVHGRYGRGPMPVEFQEALDRLHTLLLEAYARGEIGGKRDGEDL
jgi:hypothetical protein